MRKFFKDSSLSSGGKQDTIGHEKQKQDFTFNCTASLFTSMNCSAFVPKFQMDMINETLLIELAGLLIILHGNFTDYVNTCVDYLLQSLVHYTPHEPWMML